MVVQAHAAVAGFRQAERRLNRVELRRVADVVDDGDAELLVDRDYVVVLVGLQVVDEQGEGARAHLRVQLPHEAAEVHGLTAEAKSFWWTSPPSAVMAQMTAR